MQVSENGVVVTIPDDLVNDEHTKVFVGVLVRMLAKGVGNPAYQLHTLSLISTGKSFLELCNKDTGEGPEALIEAAKMLAGSMVDTITEDGTHADMTKSTLDDFLGSNLGGIGD